MKRKHSEAVSIALALLFSVECGRESVRAPARAVRRPTATGMLTGTTLPETVVCLSDSLTAEGRLPEFPAVLLPGPALTLSHGRLSSRICAGGRGSRLSVRSLDGTFVDLAGYYGLSDNAFRHKFVLAGDHFEFTLDRPGLMSLEDENSPAERAFLYVAPTSVFAVADAGGRFVLENVPTGRRQFTAWNSEKGVDDEEARVAAGKTATLDFAFAGKPR